MISICEFYNVQRPGPSGTPITQRTTGNTGPNTVILPDQIPPTPTNINEEVPTPNNKRVTTVTNPLPPKQTVPVGG